MNEDAVSVGPLIGPPANIQAPSSDKQVESHVDTRPSEDDSPELVRRAQRGDADAFGLLYQRNRASVYRLARSYLGGDVDDAVAETFVRAWKGLPRYRDRGLPFAAWLYGIARNVVKDELRFRKRAEPRSGLPEATVTESPEVALDLLAALGRLSDEHRKVIEMKYLMGLDNVAIAKVMRRSTGAVNAMRWRALAELRKVVER
ncbi:MAG: RNA polymerase sigma factor [Actinomycetota bacterium]